MLSGCLDSSDKNVDTGEYFVFTMLDGTIKNLSEYRGKVVVLDLMRVIGCVPCLIQFIELKSISKNYSSSDVVIISIDVSQDETIQDIQSTIDAFKQELDMDLDWIFGIDDGSIWEKYRITSPGGVPTLYIFDKNGKVYYSKEGYESYSLLASKIDELLSRK